MLESLSTQPKKDAGLTQASFDHLLSCLGPDRESAGGAYVNQWHALFTYFAVRGAEAPDLLTDETFDRVARRLSEGQKIVTASPANYFYGVARNVWRESLAKAGIIMQLTDETASRLISPPTPHELMLKSFETAASENSMARLEKCLAQFSAEDRDLLISYYRGIGGVKIRHREALASRLGVSLDSLRHRVARLRIKLVRALSNV
ncbi:MAG TPA: sigma-70 family RNA polymerase sigma factor [Blastocatellia bacterium]|nr:sigma-70 family RNA polymerase sigma factor [Blastocatellia bacterium]